MLAIRMQRTGRKGYPTYRVVVQEAHRQPTSGKVVANLGSYNPHTKVATIDKEKAATYLKNGAQPSDRVVKLLQSEKVELPSWVKVTSDKKQKTIKNAEKLRRNQPKEEPAETKAQTEEPQADVGNNGEASPAETAETTEASSDTVASNDAAEDTTEENKEA